MSTLTDKKINRAKKVWFTEEMLYVLLEDGRESGAPIEWFPKLRQASKEQLTNCRLIGGGIGIHWEGLDKDLSVNGLLK